MSEHKTKEDCEATGGTWNEESKTCTKQTTDTDLIRKVAMLEAELETRKTQLRQAIDIANRYNATNKAKEEAEKTRLIESIGIDSKFSKGELQAKSLAELETMRTTLDRSIEKTFANVAAQIDEEKRKSKPLLTIGAWDSEKKAWVGGV